MVQSHKPDPLETTEEERSQEPQRHDSNCTVYRCLLVLGTVGLLTGTSIGVWSLVKRLLKPSPYQESVPLRDPGAPSTGCRALVEGQGGDQEAPVGDASGKTVFFRVNRSSFLLEVQAEGRADWLLLCHENWDRSLGASVCRQLGHARLTHHKGVNLTDVKVNSGQEYALFLPSWKRNVPGQWHVRSRCPSGRIVALKCSECGTAYSKMSHAEKGAGLGRRPWEASLYLNGKRVCAGALVSNEWVATAAHCVDGHLELSGWVASLGPEASDKGQAGLSVQKVVSHPDYDSESHDYDIALLKLKEPLAFSEAVQAVCLPLSDRDLPKDSACWSSAGVYQSPGNATAPSAGTQGEVQVSLLPSNHCNSSCMYAGKITPRMLCALSLDTDATTCEAGTGSPLVCQQEHAARLVGIGTRATRCPPPRLPGVYTKVAGLLDWIHDVVGEEG